MDVTHSIIGLADVSKCVESSEQACMTYRLYLLAKT